MSQYNVAGRYFGLSNLSEATSERFQSNVGNGVNYVFSGKT